MRAGLYFALTAAMTSVTASLSYASAVDEDLCGEAAWFEDGGLTASGEQSEPGALTAAHPSLPFGTRVEIDNLANEHSVVVRINDRASFARGRVILVSRSAAEELDMIRHGTANVRLTVLGDDGNRAGQCWSAAEIAQEDTTVAAEESAGDPDTSEAENAAAALPGTGNTLPNRLEESTISPQAVGARFEVAFRPQTWQEDELSMVVAALAPRRRAQSQRKQSAPAIPWPALDGLKPLRFSPALIAYVWSDNLSLPHLARFERSNAPAHLSQLTQ